MEERTPRRTFLARAAVGAGAAVAAVLPASPASAGRFRRVWKLDPEWGRNQGDCGATPHKQGADCHACRACHRHARNKLFSSYKAANRPKKRAHTHCKCMAKKGPKITRKKWRKLFVKPNGTVRPSVDKRDPRVKKILGL